MDDSNTPDVDQSEHRSPLGIASFAQNEREQFGQKVRLAMGCMEGIAEPMKGKALPLDEASIRQRLKALSHEITSHHADLLELLVRFDDLEGWKTSGTRHCAAWMNLEIGIGIQSGWEYLRVGRKLRSLPTLKALFSAGKLTWSKVREITRVADKDNEKTLCHAALDATVSEVQRLCQGYGWTDDDNGKGENDEALQRWDSRSLTWSEASNGSTRIQLILPPEIAQAYLISIACGPVARTHATFIFTISSTGPMVAQRLCRMAHACARCTTPWYMKEATPLSAWKITTSD
ncbi:MAG: hypothetical protein ACI8VW_002212 [bacterium]|jgi:hypothetical protein